MYWKRGWNAFVEIGQLEELRKKKTTEEMMKI